jgi:hypothetical protein
MKLVHITFHFEFAEIIEKILDRYDIPAFARYPMIEGKDGDGKHYGNKVFPGTITVVQALAADEEVEHLLDALGSFKKEKEAHEHLEVLVLPVERRL